MIKNVYTSQPPANATILGAVAAEKTYTVDVPFADTIEDAYAKLAERLANIEPEANSSLAIYAASYKIVLAGRKIFATGTVASTPK